MDPAAQVPGGPDQQFESSQQARRGGPAIGSNSAATMSMPGSVRPGGGILDGDVSLVAVERGAYVGSLHRGYVAVSTPSGDLVTAAGDPGQPIFLRSAAKPFQVMPAILTGAVERFRLTNAELAVLCASHSGEPRHAETVLGILRTAGLDESFLRCGTHPPLDEHTARDLWRAGGEPSALHNNCSGAHTGMLLACVINGWPIDNYGARDHPIQVAIREILSRYADVTPEMIEEAGDNCAVPTFRLPLERAAQSFARLATGKELPPDLAVAARRVVHAMTHHPEMVGGEARFDTEVMRAAKGSIVAKGGAEGVQALGVIPQQLGIVVKITDGNARAIPPIVMALIDALELLPREASDVLAEYRRPAQYDLRNELVGHLTPVVRFGGRE